MKSIVITQLRHGFLAGAFIANTKGVRSIVGSKSETIGQVAARVATANPKAKVGWRNKNGSIAWMEW